MANEASKQRLMQFLQIVQNPALAPFAKMDFIIREIAKSMDLDPDKVVNSISEAQLQAEILKGMQENHKKVSRNASSRVRSRIPLEQGVVLSELNSTSTRRTGLQAMVVNKVLHEQPKTSSK